MVTVTKTDITDVAPEFASVAEPTVNIFIGYARHYVGEGVWGEAKAKQGIVWMACHLMKKIGFGEGTSTPTPGGSSGPVTMEKVGDLQRSYQALSLQGVSALDSVLATTSYGQMFIMLRKTVPTSPLVI